MPENRKRKQQQVRKCSKKLVAKELVAKELVAKELVAKELVAKELVAKELVAKELVIDWLSVCRPRRDLSVLSFHKPMNGPCNL
jgi:hypothetical protein